MYNTQCLQDLLFQSFKIIVSNASSATNATSVFNPDQITAGLGDLVLFNFTEGNHTATQSAFFAPCESVNYTNGTNGFDSNFVVVPTNFSLELDGAFPILAVPILESNVNITMWFYDVNTCAEGGVGVINLVAGDPATSGDTLDGFRVSDLSLRSSFHQPRREGLPAWLNFRLYHSYETHFISFAVPPCFLSIFTL